MKGIYGVFDNFNNLRYLDASELTSLQDIQDQLIRDIKKAGVQAKIKGIPPVERIRLFTHLSAAGGMQLKILTDPREDWEPLLVKLREQAKRKKLFNIVGPAAAHDYDFDQDINY